MMQTWTRIENWLLVNAAPVVDSLAPGASEADMDRLDEAIGVALPIAFRSLFRVHNGQRQDTPYEASACLFEYRWYSTADMLKKWKMLRRLLDRGDFAGLRSAGPPEIDPSCWWNPAWIPFTGDGGGNYCCLDLAPGPGGNVGQIIFWWHDEANRSLAATCLESWLTIFAQRLEKDFYHYSKKDGGLVLRPERARELARGNPHNAVG